MSPLPVLAFATALSIAAASDSVIASAASPSPTPDNRVASIYISQDFVNEEIALHSHSALLQDMKVTFDPEKDHVILTGLIQVPIEELRAINIDPKIGAFRFQVMIKPSITKKGYFVLDFPLSETYFYPAVSKDPAHERVIIPVQLLSLALASARGYLAALSGDFSGFDRRTGKLQALMTDLDRSIKHEKNADALTELQNQRHALSLQLEAVPVERKQLEAVAKEYTHILGFTGEKELNLNDELGSRKNALIFKIKLGQLAPYLNDVELGGLRIVMDKKDGGGQNYLAIDVDSPLAQALPPREGSASTPRPGTKVAPSMIMRLNQSLFESSELLETEKKDVPSNVRDLSFDLRDDGLHVTGTYHTMLIFNVSFETIVDVKSNGDDSFDVKVRELKAGGVNLGFMTPIVLESMKKRLNHALKGLCHFKYVGEESDHSRALRVTVDPKELIPAFPDMHLVDVDVREREFLLKLGHSSSAAK